LFCVIAVVAAAVAPNAVKPASLEGKESTGTILSAQWICEAPCKENMGLYLTATDAMNFQTQPTKLVQILPPAPEVAGRDFNMLTTFNPSTNVMTTVATDFPEAAQMTVWTHIVSGAGQDSMAASVRNLPQTCTSIFRLIGHSLSLSHTTKNKIK